MLRVFSIFGSIFPCWLRYEPTSVWYALWFSCRPLSSTNPLVFLVLELILIGVLLSGGDILTPTPHWRSDLSFSCSYSLGKMPSITVDVSPDLLLWAGTQALENSNTLGGERLLQSYYNKTGPPLSNKKKSTRTCFVSKIRSWTHHLSHPFSHLNSPTVSLTTELSLFPALSLYASVSDLSSTLVSDGSTQFKLPEPTSVVVSPIIYPSINNSSVASISFVTSLLANNISSAPPSLDDSNCLPVAKDMASQTDSGNPSASTPSNSSSSNASVPPSPYPYPFLVPMPQPGIPGSPHFDGTNVTEFLDRYSNMCHDYHISDKRMVRRMLWYCNSIVAQNIRSLPAYQESNWKTLAEAMTKEYAEEDEVQVMYSVEYLKRLKGLDWSKSNDLDLYCQQYKAISNELISKGHFNKMTQY